MPTYTQTDPFTPIVTAMWSMLEAQGSFTDIVMPGNRLKYVGAKDPLGNPARHKNPIKHGVQAAQFPNTIIEMADGTTTVNFSSGSGVIEKMFRIKVATGNKQAELMAQLEWVIVSTFASQTGQPTAMAALTWRGSQYVKHFGTYSVEETFRERQLEYISWRVANRLSRRETGWATVWTAKALLAFPISDITPGNG